MLSIQRLLRSQLVFCFFAHSVKLLPNGFFPKLLKRAAEKPDNAKRYFDGLFAAMETGGDYDMTAIPEGQAVLAYGGQAVAIDFKFDRSTTKLISKVRRS